MAGSRQECRIEELSLFVCTKREFVVCAGNRLKENYRDPASELNKDKNNCCVSRNVLSANVGQSNEMPCASLLIRAPIIRHTRTLKREKAGSKNSSTHQQI